MVSFLLLLDLIVDLLAVNRQSWWGGDADTDLAMINVDHHDLDVVPDHNDFITSSG